MTLAWKIAAAVAAGILLGLIATWLTVVRGGLPNAVANGPWKTSLAIGSTRSDPYTRASVALHALFALDRRETIYFTADTDNSGNRLDGRCRYEITGRDPSARWWSITAYGDDDFLIPNVANRYSVDQTSLTRRPDGTFTIAVGGTSGANWIPVGQGDFSLTLRLYNPGPDVALDPGETVLPAIVRTSCP